jgi:hypothetical protein
MTHQPPPTPTGRPREPASPPGLEHQIAALAAQVRNLGRRLTNEQPPAHVEPAGRDEDGFIGNAQSRNGHSAPVASASLVSANILAAARAAADGIRAEAEQKARDIRDAVAPAPSEQVGDEQVGELLAIVARQCASVAALESELGRVEQSVSVLRSQLSALDADWRAMLATINAVANPRR